MIESDPVPEIWEEDAGAYDEAREDDGWLPLFGLLREYGRYCPVKIGKEPLMRVGKQRLPELIEQDRLSGSRNSPERTGWELHITSPRLVVIDCEHPEKKGPGSLGPDGFATFEAFWKAHVDELAETLIVQSASGGLHYYFLLPWDLLASGQQLAGRIGALSGVDVITAGTKVILPGTEVDVKNGPGKYSVRQGLDVGIAEMPHPLALAFSELLGYKETESRKKRTKTAKTRAERRPVQAPINPGRSLCDDSEPARIGSSEAHASRMGEPLQYRPRRSGWLWKETAADPPTISRYRRITNIRFRNSFRGTSRAQPGVRVTVHGRQIIV